MAILALLIAVGAYLRLANLGQLGFRWDEDLSSLAVRAILDNGVPELPSGMIYLRGGLFLYLMTASAWLFDFSELSLRLPAALFGIGSIPLGFVFGRALFDARTGLLVAGLIALSQWDIEFSRYARMYAPFTVFYVLTLYAIWKYRVQTVSSAGSAVCIALAIGAISFHQLGYTLVPAFFFPLILRGPAEWLRPRNWRFPMGAGFFVAVFFFFWNATISRYMALPRTMPGQGFPVTAQTAESSSVVLEKLPLLSGMLDAAPALLVLAGAVSLAITAFIAVRRELPMLHRVLLLWVTACCVLQLFNVAILALIALAFLKREGLRAIHRPDVLFAGGIIAVTFLAWVAIAAVFGLWPTDPSQGSTGLKGAIRALLNYPHFFVFWGYVREWPMVSLVAAIGGLWAFHRASLRATAPEEVATARASGFLLLTLSTPLIANGLFETSFELFRYNVPLNTFYFTFVALAVVHWREVLIAIAPPDRRLAPRGAGAAAGTALLVLLALAFDMNPVRGWLVTRQDHFNDGALYRAFGMERNRDFRTPAEYLARNATAEDVIVVLDSREYYNYLGRLDYWVRTGVYETQSYMGKDGRLRDQYVGTPLIMSLDELQDVLGTPGRIEWLIASDAALEGSRAVTDDIKDWIRSQHGHVVYVGRDGTTKVYRFD